jgi:hypothetical protein
MSTLRSDLASALAALSLATCGLSQDAESAKPELSRTSVTRMPAYNVDENVSPKTHTLFMGADIDLNLDRDLYRVHDVMGSNWVVEIGGRDRVISAKEAPVNLKIVPSLKLTESSVTIVGFMRVPTYSFANDPNVRLTRGLNQSAVMGADLQSMARDAQAREDVSANHALGGASLLAGSDDQFSANAIMTTAKYAYSQLHTRGTDGAGLPLASPNLPSSSSTAGDTVIPGMQMDPAHNLFNNPTQVLNNQLRQVDAVSSANQAQNGNEPTGKIVSGGLDAIDVKFDVRSAKLLQNPYVVTMTRFRTKNTKNSKPGMVQNLVYAKSLNPIDEHLSHIHFVEEGFPEGYELVDFQMHIYNRGVELASNIADNRVELTREEAFEYIKMEYLGSHLKDTLPPVAAMGKLPVDLPAKLAAGKYTQTFYVKVSRDGYADEAYNDEACRTEVGDAFLNSVVKGLRFKPALINGKAVDATAPVNLGKLQI